VTKTVGGVTFDDPFPQLYDDTPEALAWQWKQDEAARRIAEASPNYGPVRDRLLELRPGDRFQYAPVKAGGLWFSVGEHESEAALLVQEELAGPARANDTAGRVAARHGASNAALFAISPSPGGTYVAVGLVLDGDSIGPWAVYEVASGRVLFDTPRSMLIIHPGWLPDESGFWMGDHAENGEHRLRFFPVGEDVAGRPEVALPPQLVEARQPGVTPQVSPDGRWAVLVTQPHEHTAVVLLDLHTLEARPFLPDGWVGECDGGWDGSDTYVARVNGDAPRGRVVAIPIATSRDPETWRELVGEGEGFLNCAGVVAGRLYVLDTVDVAQRVRVFDLDGGGGEALSLPGPCSLPSFMISRAIAPTEAFACLHATFTQSAALMVHEPETGALRRVRAPKVELEGVLVERRFATSADGTRIPYFIVHRSDLDLSRPLPALVHAYGGFNVSLLPDFPSQYAPFIEAGGVYVQASLRGGGEYGRAWHDAGRLEHKQHTFDDLAAVAQALIDEGVSAPDRMAFEGHSNGGLLAGVAIVQQPHLWRAVVPNAPLLDMMEPFPPSPEAVAMQAVFADDYGDLDDPEMAPIIFGWSPCHNIRDGVSYPAVYQVFGENDPACAPRHGRRFTARLQQADAGGRPICLRVWRNTGHVVFDPAQAAAATAEWLSFVMDQVGLSYTSSQKAEAAQ
jgi:prolyl oligopeptidase